MWGNKVFFLYGPRRVECPTCGIRVERMPWVAGKHRLTEALVSGRLGEAAKLEGSG